MSEYRIFTLGNDGVIDWLIPFFNSLRAINSSVRVSVIPFDERIEELTNYQKEYDFDIIPESRLVALQKIGHDFWDGNAVSAKTWKKLACFTETHEPFLFLDSDIVFNVNPDELVDIYRRSGVDFMCFDLDETQVYKSGSFLERMKREYKSKSFNSGGFVSKGGLFSEQVIRQVAEQAYVHREHFLGWGDQTFINYLIDTSEIELAAIHEIDHTFSTSTWARNEIKFDDGIAYIEEKKMAFIHWAGYKIDFMMPEKNLYMYWRFKKSSAEENKLFKRKMLRTVLKGSPLKSILRRLIPQAIKNWVRDKLD